ncbi:MAG: hypothetical protein ABL983_21945, partial [Nitrospira sp.]
VYLQYQEEAGNSHVGLFCFWRREPSRGAALLSIGPGSSNSLRFLVNPEAQDDAWWDVTAPMADEVSAKTEGASQLPTIDVQDSLMTVAQLMRHRMGRTGTTIERVGIASTPRARSTPAVL